MKTRVITKAISLMLITKALAFPLHCLSAYYVSSHYVAFRQNINFIISHILNRELLCGLIKSISFPHPQNTSRPLF